jgi:hypothetical protein
MELTYDEIEKWIKEYFDTYSKYGQKVDTADRMLEYFTPDMRFIPYIAGIGGPERGFHTAQEFVNAAKNHAPVWYERLTPDIITIDERNKSFVALFRMEVCDAKTNEIKVKKSAMSHYELTLDANKKIKIKTIRFFWETMPEGKKEFYEIFNR